jgi:hypothetical protein
MRSHLDEAVRVLNQRIAVDVVDVGKLAESDYRTGYGTPTILLNGQDLLGAPIPAPAAPT